MRTETRKPTTPGEMLSAEFLEPMGMSHDDLAMRMGVETATVDELITGEQAVTTDHAVRLATALGGDAQFWINCQAASDRWVASKGPYDYLHPGETLLEDVMPALELTAQQFAERLGVDETYLTEAMHGRAPITSDLACRLEREGISTARTWRAMQQGYDARERVRVKP